MPTTKSNDEKINTIIIAVGGKGKRLQQYFKSINFTFCKQLYPINTKPLLCHIIDLAYNNSLSNIILMAGNNDVEIKRFVKQYYPVKKIKVVNDRINKNGKKIGMPQELWYWSKQLNHDYIFVDGNIIFSDKIIKKLLAANQRNTIFTLAANSSDIAPTHSAVVFIDNKLKLISARNAAKELTIAESKLGKIYCSMGLMKINRNFGDSLILPKINDLDIYIEMLYKKQVTKNILTVNVIKDNQYWLALHDPSDIDRLAKVD